MSDYSDKDFEDACESMWKDVQDMINTIKAAAAAEREAAEREAAAYGRYLVGKDLDEAMADINRHFITEWLVSLF